MQVSPLAMFAQVGAVRKEVGRGGEYDCCDPVRQLDLPMTPKGEVGGRGGGSDAVSTLARVVGRALLTLHTTTTIQTFYSDF